MTRDEAATLIREIQHARPAQGTLLYRCMEAISMLLEDVEQAEMELAALRETVDD